MQPGCNSAQPNGRHFQEFRARLLRLTFPSGTGAVRQVGPADLGLAPPKKRSRLSKEPYLYELVPYLAGRSIWVASARRSRIEIIMEASTYVCSQKLWIIHELNSCGSLFPRVLFIRIALSIKHFSESYKK